MKALGEGKTVKNGRKGICVSPELESEGPNNGIGKMQSYVIREYEFHQYS